MGKLIVAFVVGGAICVLAQLTLDLTNLNPAYVMVVFVALGAVFSGLGLYGPLVEFAGAGATIPLPGFGHALTQGMLEEIGGHGVFGVLAGGLSAVSMGLSVAILFGYIMALVSSPKG